MFLNGIKTLRSLVFLTYQNRIGRQLAFLAVAGMVHLTTRLDQWNHPMVGDDFLGIRDSQMPIRNGSFIENVWLVGGGKWRPLSTSILLWLGQSWGYDYAKFQILNSILLVGLAWATGFVALRLGVPFGVAMAMSGATVLSPFTWMAQTSIYGMMELLALLLTLASAYFAIKVISNHARSRLNVVLSVIFLFAAGHAHERFVSCSLVLTLFFLCLSKSHDARRWAWTPLLIPIFYVASRAFVLRLDPLQGGGESNLGQNLGNWIIAHFFDAMRMLFGGYSATGVFYTANPLADLRTRSDLDWLPVVAVAGLSLICLLFLREHSAEGRTDERRRKLSQSMLLLCLSLSVLLPAATVAERIEGRWLFAPQVLIVLAVGVLSSRSESIWGVASRYFCPVFFCLVALYYLPNSADYLRFRDQPSQVMSAVAEAAPEYGPWVLVISQVDPAVPTEWQFGYGNAFTQLPNPPYLASVVTGRRNDCPVLKKQIPCVVVRLSGLEDPGKPAVVLTRIASISINRS